MREAALSFGLILIVAAQTCGAAGSACTYSVFWFDSFRCPNVHLTLANGVNDSGQIVGNCVTYEFGGSAYLKDGENFTFFSYPGGQPASATGINNSGQIVGSYGEQTNHLHGFLKIGANFTTFDYPGAQITAPQGINNNGQIVGTYGDTSNLSHGFLLTAGNFTSIDYPGALSTSAWGINDHGQIVGFYSDATGLVHGFLRDAGNFTSIDYPGATSTQAYGISNDGQIVGLAGILKPFLKDGSGFMVLPSPYLVPWGISNNGEIVGTIEVPGFSTELSFALTPSATTVSVSLLGATGGIGVVTGADCAWTASSDVAWITITSAASSSTGSGQFGYSVAPNKASGPRTGTLTIAGQALTITQADERRGRPRPVR